MVDFRKKLAGKNVVKPAAPSAIYETLDRRHDKGPLRPAQEAVLADWFESRQSDRDVLVKLHTGQGKTLVGLLMLQSRLNRDEGPVVYLCPDNYLIDQTCEQAKQFGIATCKTDPDLPGSFLDGQRILVTSVQKLFNGLTKFGLANKSIKINTILMDDAHACADVIRDSCKLRISKDEPAYGQIRALFADDLEQQGLGTYADIVNDDRDSFLPVPYWAWLSKVNDVAAILSRQVDKVSVKFSWPLLRDKLRDCLCVFSGQALEIEAYSPPLDAFGSYADADHRIFMSATVTDDSFLVKGLKIGVTAITSPLTYAKEKWSGEKMVLLPSLLDESLDRGTIVQEFATPDSRRSYGVVGLAPGFAWTKDWEKYGAIVANKDTLGTSIDRLKSGAYGLSVVLVNRYNGIDLPDDNCRVLVFDSRPYSESLIDTYEEACRSNSVITLMRVVRTVEQGMGRSVRGEKDYSAIIITGSDLTRLVRDKRSRQFLSSQMATQIEIGIDIANMGQEEIENGVPPVDALKGLIRQCLSRDDGWKAFYAESMSNVKPSGANADVLGAYEAETKAEALFDSGDPRGAVAVIQALMDSSSMDSDERGWYLQTMARYMYAHDRVESQRFQVNAHKNNKLVLKPTTGVAVSRIQVINEGRAERIAAWMTRYVNYAELEVALFDVLAKLSFGVKADKFEQGLDELSGVLGFLGERPDKEWKEGPDNLWALDTKQYLLWECKNEVDTQRSEINKREAEQMNRSSAWFIKHYAGMNVKRIMVHPAAREESAASLLHEVEVMRPKQLNKLVANVRAFFKSFSAADFSDLSHALIQKRLQANNLMISNFFSDYTTKIKSK